MNKNERLSEFFYISHTIADISHENSHISSELDEKVAALKKYQIAALQAQINPHFLFNTLQLINLSIMKEVKKDIAATRLISLLSNLLHYSYDTEHYTVTVQQEIDNALKYLEIQQGLIFFRQVSLSAKRAASFSGYGPFAFFILCCSL